VKVEETKLKNKFFDLVKQSLKSQSLTL